MHWALAALDYWCDQSPRHCSMLLRRVLQVMGSQTLSELRSTCPGRGCHRVLLAPGIVCGQPLQGGARG